MNSIVLVIIGALVLVLGYRVYGAFIAAKVLVLDDTREVPSKRFEDGHDFVPTNKLVLMGHHFAAIAGAGPLIGPVLAAQYGYLPGTLWILIGGVLAGAVHDMVILFASVRHDGESLVEIAKSHLGPTMGFVTAIAVLFILIIAMAGLGLPIVNSLNNSPWGTFTVGFTIPVAMFIGIYLKFIRPGKIGEGTVIGMALIILGVILGPYIQHTALAPYLTFNLKQMSLILAFYGFCAAAIPVWLLLLPRDYLSTYMKLGVVFLLAIGILIVRPDIKMPAITPFVNGGGPIVPGKVFPYIFITIACGALSGFHSLISSGTTPKLISYERDILPIGFGAMLLESFVALMALIAATCLPTADYFAINSTAAVFAKLHMTPVELPMLNQLVGESLAGRTGGGVSLAVGMAYVFYKIPGMAHLLGYWYHFIIMFEALFILTTIDAGTRIGRYLLQDFAARFHKPFGNKNSWPNIIVFSGLVSFAWGYLLYTGNVSIIWPMFGTANQMLAVIALAVGTSVILKTSKNVAYACITGIPTVIMAFITGDAAILNITGNYLPKGLMLMTVISGLLLVLMVIIVVESFRVWKKDIAEIKNSDVAKEA
ncbi:MAG: carbon starvation protein A [Solirubrobacterales bacterium]